MRLNKFIAEQTEYSRRKADELISAGRVAVNGQNASLGTQVDPEKDAISVDGQILKNDQKVAYYALYKPRNVVSTASDPANRKKVTDFVPPNPRVYPVGRLDYSSEGLIILTNDGDFANQLMHPRYEHEKEYEVNVRIKNIELIIKDIEKAFLGGLNIDGQLMAMKEIEIQKLNPESLILRTILITGYNRQIRRMCDKIGLEVTKLKRVRIGKLDLKKLRLNPGEYKPIRPTDIL
jgi:23S rRNA pseudouridine2605 synthase